MGAQETTYTPAELVAEAKVMFGPAWDEGHPSFHTEDWLYWRTAHALEAAQQQTARLESMQTIEGALAHINIREEHIADLEGQVAFYEELGASMLPQHVRDELEGQRDALAAVIAEASGAVLLHEHTPASLHMVRILAAADTDAALREVRAKALEQAADDLPHKGWHTRNEAREWFEKRAADIRMGGETDGRE